MRRSSTSHSTSRAHGTHRRAGVAARPGGTERVARPGAGSPGLLPRGRVDALGRHRTPGVATRRDRRRDRDGRRDVVACGSRCAPRERCSAHGGVRPHRLVRLGRPGFGGDLGRRRRGRHRSLPPRPHLPAVRANRCVPVAQGRRGRPRTGDRGGGRTGPRRIVLRPLRGRQGDLVRAAAPTLPCLVRGSRACAGADRGRRRGSASIGG